VCWVDLAARDLPSARAFYRGMFGWQGEECRVNGGTFTRLDRSGEPVGSIYQLQSVSVQGGTPSHWLPYVRVGDVHAACMRAVALGGLVIVRPFDAGLARIAVVLDTAGAQIGLWEDGRAA
jgi:predicted enzyme related to lactoylglutathione lyase